MGRLATYIAVDGDRLDAIWDLPDDEFRSGFRDLENDKQLQRLEIDKIWDALHCTLTGQSASEPIDGNRLSESIVGTYPKLLDDDDYSLFVSVIDNEDIREILAAIEPFDRAKLASVFDPATLEDNDVYPSGIWDDSPEALVDEMASAIESMRRFFVAISDTNLHILATVV